MSRVHLQMTSEELMTLTDEEIHEYASMLVKEGNCKSSAVGAAFVSPNGNSIDLKDIVRTAGEDEAIDLITQAIKCMKGDNGSNKVLSATKEDIDNISRKVENNETLTEEEQMLYNVITKQCIGLRQQFLNTFTDSVLSLIGYSVAEKHFVPQISDIILPVGAFVTAALTDNEKLETGKLRQSKPETVQEMGRQMYKDMLDTWKASMSTPVSDEMIILAAIALISDFSEKLECPFGKEEELASLYEDDNENTDTSTIDENQDLKDLLKE